MDIITIAIYISIYLGLLSTSFFILTFIADKKTKNIFYNDNELPKVSVIIPAYNEEKSIEKTIKSILESNYPNFEVLVIDDGSKDNTLKLAKNLESDKVKVYSKENGGKATALNFGIAKATGEIIFSMDADTFVDPESMKRMVRYFKNQKIMSVTPAMVLYKPKGVLQRIQHAEYIFGLFLRKVFASLNSVYITPGAFSAYRKTFFDKYGGYDEGNITEDLEMSLRIQYNGYTTENCPDAPAYTIAPSKFKALLIQRVRWYYGLILNSWKYRKIISTKYGDLGAFVLPIGWISIFFSIFLTIFIFIRILFDVQKEILFLKSINFNFFGAFHINFYAIERFLFLFFTNPVLLFLFVFMIFLGVYMKYASKKIKISGMVFNLPLYFILFAILFGFWWIVSIGYALFNKKVKWR